MRDVVIETFRTGDNIYSVVGQSEAQHTFTNSFTFDYGIWDNLTFSIRLPLVAVYDTERSLDAYSLGDISTSLRWQPWSSARGKPVTVLYAALGCPPGKARMTLTRAVGSLPAVVITASVVAPTFPTSSTRWCCSAPLATPTTCLLRMSIRFAAGVC